jgi:hypothetical protein
VLRLSADGPVEREIRAVHKKADLAAAVFQRDILVTLVDPPVPLASASA